jgi:3',5'-cyclic AMP phosphodiesterase CpdA
MENTIIISDTHAPYHHKDTLRFIDAIVDTYGIVDAKHTGDIVDNHFSSFHDIEYGTYSAVEEHKRACSFIKELEDRFPELIVVLGNHDILTERKAIKGNIQREHIKDYNARYYTPGWQFLEYDYFRINKYNNCLLRHSISSSTLNNAKQYSHCSIQGHHHGSYGIEYFSDTETLRWAMTVGCLVDSHSPAFNYARSSVLKRQIIGCGGIINDIPVLFPMQLTKSGRWNNKI